MVLSLSGLPQNSLQIFSPLGGRVALRDLHLDKGKQKFLSNTGSCSMSFGNKVAPFKDQQQNIGGGGGGGAR